MKEKNRFQNSKDEAQIIKPLSTGRRGPEYSQEENSEGKSASDDGSEAVQRTMEDEDSLDLSRLSSNLFETESCAKSTEMEILQLGRRPSDYFLTASWPRGILKVRSRSFSDSQVDFKSHSMPMSDGYCNAFSSSFECEDEEDLGEEEEEPPQEEEEKTGEEEGDGSESSSTKKCVRFNDNVCKQVFRRNASILGQRSKNQKKARQKKRSRDRKLSEESGQSSETENLTDHSDVATTEEDSSAEVEAVKNHKVPPIYSQPPRSRKSQSRKPKKNGQKSTNNNRTKGNKKHFLNLSNEMLFQLDEI